MRQKMKVRMFAVAVLFLSAAAEPGWAASVEGKKGLLPINSNAPDFRLTDVVSGKTVSRDDFSEKKGLLVIMLCRHCPYVQRVKEGLAALGRDYANKDLAIVAISSNDAAVYPEDGPESLKEMALETGFNFPVLYDETQEVGKAYTAIATPDFFLFDGQRRLVYRGQFDDARPSNEVAVAGRDVRAAIDALLDGKPIPSPQKPSVGCSIKWKKGNEPVYL